MLQIRLFGLLIVCLALIAAAIKAQSERVGAFAFVDWIVSGSWIDDPLRYQAVVFAALAYLGIALAIASFIPEIGKRIRRCWPS